jgi:hypothetical protein
MAFDINLIFYIPAVIQSRKRYSSIGIVISYGLDYRGQRIPFPAGGKTSLLQSVQTGPIFHTEPYYLVPGVKHPKREADHLFASSADFNLLKPRSFFTYHQV